VDNPELGGGPLTPSQRVSTIATILGVTSPIPAAKPAVKKERDGKIVIPTGASQGKITPA
jgi:hypothetical protein